MNKLITRQECSRIASELKQQGKKVVFTNGCFDIVHAGHVTYLEQAKVLGDILVIGLNSDESVKKLKGNNRPILNQKDRAKLLEAFYFVDYIVLFDQETPIELLKSIKPSLHIKGGDYKAKDLPEYEIVKTNGGQVKILPFVTGKSTSEIIDKIRKT